MERSGSAQDVTDAPRAVGKSISGDQLEQHVLQLGHRSYTGFTGYDDEYLILEYGWRFGARGFFSLPRRCGDLPTVRVCGRTLGHQRSL